jgi:hypothetical protein
MECYISNSINQLNYLPETNLKLKNYSKNYNGSLRAIHTLFYLNNGGDKFFRNTDNCIFYYISNKMQCYTVYFIWKLHYMLRVVHSPIIRSANNCIYSIWYLSHRYCYLPLAADSSNGVTNTRCCR